MSSWLFRAILTKYLGLLAIGVMAGIAGILSFIVLKLCGLDDEKARTAASDLGEKVGFALFVLMLAIGTAYWIWQGYKAHRARKIPPPLPTPLPVPARLRPMIQEVVSLVASPSSGNHTVAGGTRSGGVYAIDAETRNDGRGIDGPMRFEKSVWPATYTGRHKKKKGCLISIGALIALPVACIATIWFLADQYETAQEAGRG